VKLFAIVAASACIVGCSTVTDVVPTGKDTYMVGSNARGGFTSDAALATAKLASTKQEWKHKRAKPARLCV
jgi:hypothetical protein